MTRGALRLGAVLGAAALSTIAMAPAFATHDATAEADSSASTGTGPLFEQLLDTGQCTATDTPTTETGTVTGRCGDGLNLNDQIKAFSQNASAPGDGTSAADASVAPIDIVDFASLDLTGILDGLAGVDTGTVLDEVLAPLGQGAIDALKTSGVYDQALVAIDDGLQDALAQVHENLPVTLRIGAVESHCTATAAPLTAEGNGTLAGIDLLVQLGDQQIVVPIHAETGPNSDLVVDSPQVLVDAIIDGLEATFTQSLGGALQPLNEALAGAQAQITDAIFAELEAQLLPGLSEGLAPLVKGTVNKQEPTSPSSTGEIEVTGLELVLLGDQELDLARSHCGPDRAGSSHDDAPGTNPEPQPQPGPAPGPGAADIPTQVDSGLSGSDNTAILMGTGALLLVAGVTGLAGYRRLLQQ